MKRQHWVATVVDFDEIIVQFGLKFAEGEGAVKSRRRLQIEDEGARHGIQVRRGRQVNAGAVNYWSGVGSAAAGRATSHERALPSDIEHKCESDYKKAEHA